MSLKYRRLSPSGDYTFGQGNQNFVYDIEAVGQAVQTRLNLLLGNFWYDLADGLPLFQSILGGPGSQQHLLTVDGIYHSRIAGTKDLTGISFYSSSFDRSGRGYLFTAACNTLYGSFQIQR